VTEIVDFLGFRATAPFNRMTKKLIFIEFKEVRAILIKYQGLASQLQKLLQNELLVLGEKPKKIYS